MNKKRSFIAILALMVPIFLTGCWDRMEIEERGAVLALAIDPIDGEKVLNITGPSAKSDLPGYKLTAQVAIPGRIPLGPSQGGGERASEKPVWVVSVTGKTIHDAINNLQQELADKIFLGHLRVIIVNQKIAQANGMHDVQDFLRRNAEIRRLAWLLVSTGSAKKAMEAAPKLERVPTLYLVGTMDHAVKMGKLPNVFLGNYWSILSSQGRDPVLPLISVLGEDRILVNGLALFQTDRMVGSLEPMEVATYMELTGEPIAGYGLALPVPGDSRHSVIIKGTKRTAKIKLRKEKGGKPSFDVYIMIEANIEEKTGNKSIADSKVIHQIADEAETTLQKAQEKTLQKLKRLHSDSVGFGEYVRGRDPEYWVKLKTKEKWEEVEFPKLQIRVHNDIEIRRSGMSAR